MAVLAWDKVSERTFETGVDRGVLYIPDTAGRYTKGFAWNGLVSVSESPSGAEANPQYADNIKYLNLISAEEFGATIEAFTYPDEFAQCDGTASPVAGISIGQQARKSFGLAYRTKLGNDVDGADFAYKLHLVYGALAAPTEKAYTTVNDSPEAITFSWELSTTKVDVPGHKPTALLTLDSSKLDKDKLGELEDILYGTAGADPRLPSPEEVLALFSGGVSSEVRPAAPTFNAATNTITIPAAAGVDYRINGEIVEGTVVITEDTIVTATPEQGYKFPSVSDDDWYFAFNAAA